MHFKCLEIKNINRNLLVPLRNYQKNNQAKMHPRLAFKVYFGPLRFFCPHDNFNFQSLPVTDISIKVFLCSYLHSTPRVSGCPVS